MNFGKWNNTIHEDHEQIKRIANMKKIKSQNISVNFDDKTAMVVGSKGSYDVSLDNCTCYDYDTRQLPCKHIYRLAFELGYLEDIPKVNRKASKSFNDNVQNEIERYKEYYLNGAISIEKFSKIINALQSK